MSENHERTDTGRDRQQIPGDAFEDHPAPGVMSHAQYFHGALPSLARLTGYTSRMARRTRFSISGTLNRLKFSVVAPCAASCAARFAVSSLCGLPAIASAATGGADVLTEASGCVLPVGNIDSLVESLRWFEQNRDRVPAMGFAARKQAEVCTWERYRRAVTQATATFQ